MKTKTNILLLLIISLFGLNARSQNAASTNVSPDSYLADLKQALQVKWPDNRTINIVFHSHSVPAEYFKTLQVNTLSTYPYLNSDKEKLAGYMAKENHPNKREHELIANELIKWFKQ